MAENKTVCLDFDGVLAQYAGWVSEEHTLPPVQGAREFVEVLLRKGLDVAIHTTRPSHVVMEWCDRWGFTVHSLLPSEASVIPGRMRICKEKPKALVYVDDRAFRFTGNWETAREAIWQEPWWQEGKK